MAAFLPINTSRKPLEYDTRFLLPLHSKTEKVKTDEIDYFRYDPNIHLTDVNNFKHIVNPEYQRGGLDTRNYVKDVQGTPIETTIRVPFNHHVTESKPIKPEHVRMLGRDCPALTWLNN